MMSSGAAVEEAAAADMDVCANCGIAGVDEIKLKICDGGCDLVKYCSEKCRGEHRQQHQEECKKRANKLHDKRLFTQPDGTHLEECPICFLPMPLQQNTFMECCGKTICNGCCYANTMSNFHDFLKASTCVFCRTSAFDNNMQEYRKRERERIEANHPPTLCFMATKCCNKGNYDAAFEYYTKAAELGDAQAHYRLGRMYWQGDGFEKDEEKAVYHWEKAAIGGHPYARHNIAIRDKDNGNMERAVKHWIIAANLGYGESMKALLLSYKSGYITKEEYGATLRTHQVAIDAMKSAERDNAPKHKPSAALLRAFSG
jgi:hypothetical protein